MFDKVVVITDRLVLDRQLQDTIYQFEHAHGVVVRIDKDSSQLAEALAGEQARIIITTLQKFPFVLDKVAELPARRYAVIVDEAHSSQTGEAADELRRVLSGGSEQERLESAEREDGAEEAERGDCAGLLARSLEGRGRPPNLSFFAFTATPKAKTLELFGTAVDGPEGRRYEPFHLYSMRQAIEEGFILDVLANYTTYKTYFRIEKAITDDPEYDPRRRERAIARFVTLHPHNLAQKAEIIVEHFREHTAKKIGGKAKAMVVTSSRLHAVRYKHAIDRYIAEQGYTDVHALVAFSGKVVDAGRRVHRAEHERLPRVADRRAVRDGRLPGAGRRREVPDRLRPAAAPHDVRRQGADRAATRCRRSSRLNRIHPREDGHVRPRLPQRAEEIQEAFEPVLRAHRRPADRPEPALRHAPGDLGLRRPARGGGRGGVQALLAVTETSGHGAVYAALDPARDRFGELDEEVQDAFRDVLTRFVHIYAFVSQIVSYVDRELERDYLYGRALLAYLPGQAAERLDLGSEVELTHLKIAQTFEGSGSLEEGGGEVVAIFSGRGKEHELEKEHLSRIVEVINERFGLDLGEADQLLFDQFEETWATDETLAAQARTNTFENFRLVFDRTFIETIVKRMDQNEDIFKRILDEPEFQRTVLDYYADAAIRAAARRARSARADRSPLTQQARQLKRERVRGTQSLPRSARQGLARSRSRARRAPSIPQARLIPLGESLRRRASQHGCP